MVHILNWQTDGDYCKDNALHMSNDLQIIYVTFRSIIVFAEDINCVTNIKLSAKRAELSFLLSENTEPSAPRQTCIWPSFVQHLTQCEGFLLEMPTCVADDVCVSSVLWLPGPRRRTRALTSSVPQAVLLGVWGICSNMASDTRGAGSVPPWISDSRFPSNQGQSLTHRN